MSKPSQLLMSMDGEKVQLAGRSVAQICFTSGGTAVRFILSKEHEVLTLTCDHNQRVLLGAKPGSSHNPRELAPLLELLGERGRECIFSREGSWCSRFRTGGRSPSA